MLPGVVDKGWSMLSAWGFANVGVWLSCQGERCDGLGWWWRWPGWKGVLNRISATVTAGLVPIACAELEGITPGVCIGIMCLHFKLRPFTLVENVQTPFQGEVKV